MNKNQLIGFSILLILLFTALFFIDKPSKPPKGEVDEFFSDFKGDSGFVVITFPKFLMKSMINTDTSATDSLSSATHTLRMLIYHEQKAQNSQKTIYKHVINYMEQNKFTQIEQQQRDYGIKNIFVKPYENKWKESVILFSGDSSLFVFNLISQLSREQIILTSETLERERNTFN